MTINLLPLILLPFALAFLFSKTELQTLDWKKLWKKLLGAGFLYAIPFVATALFSVEFPSVVAGLFGLVLFSVWYIPKEIQPTLQLWFKTFQPYLLFIVLLVLARIGLREISFELVEGAKKISLYQPGLVFVLASLLFTRFWPTIDQAFWSVNLNNALVTVSALKKSALAIGLLVLFTQLVQMDLLVVTESLLSSVEPELLAPLLGVAGSFTTGSATMSNLLFASIFTENAMLLALLHTGSAIGNAISLQNILMVNTVIKQPESVFEILKKTTIWVLIYLAAVLAVLFVVRLL